MAVGGMRTDELDPLLWAKKPKSQAAPDIRLCDLTDDLRDRYEERAAIIEFDGGLPRWEAEKLALQDIWGNMSPTALPDCPQDSRYGTKEARTAEVG